MEFYLKDVFKEKDELSICVLNLSIIRNDLKYCMKYVMDCFANETKIESGRQIYSQRFMVVHYREALYYIIENSDTIDKLIEEPFDDYVTVYQELFKSQLDIGKPFEDSFLKKVCIPMRNGTVHYKDNVRLIKKILKDIDKDKTYNIPKYGDCWSDTDYEFADDFAINIFLNEIEEKPIDNISDTLTKISKYPMDMIKLIDYIIAKFINNKLTK